MRKQEVMKNTFFIAITLLLSIMIVNAQSNRRVDLREFGLSFEIPDGWSGGIENDLYLLGHYSVPGMIILSENTSKDAKQLKALALKGISEEGIQLYPKGEFKIRGNDRVEGFYEGIFNGSKVRVFSIGLINQLGSGLNISIITEKAKFGDIHIREAEKLAKSVNFFRIIESPNTKFWKERLVGQQLKYLRTRTSSDSGSGSSGQSDTRIIKLFNNGTFSYYSSSSNSYWGQSGSDTRRSRDQNIGRYKIYTVNNRSYLELKAGDKTLEYELTKSQENHTLLNGDRFAVLDINRP